MRCTEHKAARYVVFSIRYTNATDLKLDVCQYEPILPFQLVWGLLKSVRLCSAARRNEGPHHILSDKRHSCFQLKSFIWL